VGRLERQKAFHLLLEAQAILLGRGVECNVCILGEGSLRTWLERRVRTLGLEGRAFLPGFVDPRPVMGRAAVLALTSVYEGAPLVIAEALAIGMPIVATDCPSGPAEMLENGRLGILVPVGDAVALADALASTLSVGPDPGARAMRMASVARFAPARTFAAWERLLCEVGSGASAP
jgi:glycosyltransferase involved in cell wall biosynthesis